MKSNELALSINNIAKQYRLGLVGTGTLSHDLNRLFCKILGKPDPYALVGDVNDRAIVGDSDYVWALKDVSFNVKKGEVVGIIGKNGAGKSTLLKLLSKVTAPSLGEMKINGRIGSLLEVGTGFHPELSGRENIFLNGAILGMKKNEIKRKLDEIISFSGVEKYIDTPVKRYSSGMKVRLAFSVAAHLEPEILIVDEVLAVGDVDFQKKCLGKMNEVSKNEGRTILFVSHNMAAIRGLCQRAILLEDGGVAFDGPVDQAISKYLVKDTADKNEQSIVNFDNDSNSIASFKTISIINGQNENTYQIEFIENWSLNIKFSLQKQVSEYGYVIIKLFDNMGNYICSITSEDIGFNNISTLSLGNYETTVKMPSKLLKPGRYTLSFMFYIEGVGSIDVKDSCIVVEVVDTVTYRGVKDKYRKNALVAPLCEWSEYKGIENV